MRYTVFILNPFTGSALSMRRRNVWEAADSGVLLWRRNFLRFLPVFVLPFAAAAFLAVFIPGRVHLSAAAALWWLKPLFERPLLYTAASRFFTRQDGRSPLLRPGGFFRSLPGDLLWRRFSPLRPVFMPLRVLERPRGRDLARRKRSLKEGGLRFARFLSALFVSLEGGFLLSEYFFFHLSLQLLRLDASFIPGSGNGMLLYILYCLNYALLEPLFVCMGFALYVNSRVQTEGWDLQFQFQHLS
ncbi:MAG: hypothetical protein LBR16_01300 [Treponema sp.]|nr:hypothetical protein [Treponema sp.]